MSILSLKSVSKSFGALTVTDDVTFEVPQGQALGIIGRNGAGKSTLVNLITAIWPPIPVASTLRGGMSPACRQWNVARQELAGRS